MRSVSSKIYDKDYYLNTCCGYVEFNESQGKKIHPRIKYFADLLEIKPGLRILDLGCGRGDLAIEAAKRGASSVGVDYSKDGIKIANVLLKKQSNKVLKNAKFFQMNARKLKFNSDSFDSIIAIDVFEHLYKEELEIVLREIKRVLKPDGKLIVHTETNKIYLDYTHRFWSYPIDRFLIKINKLLTRKNYPQLPKDPRNEMHKKQHVNEPTYYYLKSLFQRHKFYGKINSIVPLKPALGWKDRIYNVPVSLYPISRFFPLHLLFAHEYLCIMRNNKN